MKPSITILPIIVALFTATPLHAATYTVQPGGSIANAVNKSTGGDTVLVKAGNLAGIFQKLKPATNSLKSSVRKTRSGTVVSLTLVSRKSVTLTVTDPAGHTVYTTSRKDLPVGKHSFVLPPGTTRGLHLVKITTPDEEMVHKVSGW